MDQRHLADLAGSMHILNLSTRGWTGALGRGNVQDPAEHKHKHTSHTFRKLCLYVHWWYEAITCTISREWTNLYRCAIGQLVCLDGCVAHGTKSSASIVTVALHGWLLNSYSCVAAVQDSLLVPGLKLRNSGPPSWSWQSPFLLKCGTRNHLFWARAAIHVDTAKNWERLSDSDHASDQPEDG